jgi:hypothetical protein
MLIEVSRETEAEELARFARTIGLTVSCNGTVVDFEDEDDAIGKAVATWLASSRAPLVPTRLPDGSLALRPPAG